MTRDSSADPRQDDDPPGPAVAIGSGPALDPFGITTSPRSHSHTLIHAPALTS
ncbi:hypothetical protein Lfu02_79400 [Longispora fulva]|nr:hypothetical protein Lfu02_79400 [Longispora fulva]